MNKKTAGRENSTAVLATMFIYIDIIQTIFELIGKFYSSLEEERRSNSKNNVQKTRIFIGEEQYVESYTERNKEEKKEPDEDVQLLIKPKRRTSEGNAKKIIKESIQESDNEIEKENYEDI